MTEYTDRRGLVSIGELSRLTGVSVRTIRFYCDDGVLESQRGSGGHRLFDPVTSVDRLRSVRRLRVLGLGLSTIVDVLADAVSITDALAAERRALDTELGALTWRRASLLAVENATPAERATRVAQLAAVQDRHGAYDELVAFWRRLLAPLPSATFDGFVSMNIPAPPANPTAAHVLAYAELATTITDPAMARAMTRQLWRIDDTDVGDKRALITGVAEACEVVGPLVDARIAPRPGAELDRFLAAHAAARGEPDSPRLRRRLLSAGADDDPRIHRYWTLTTEITGTTTAGAAHHWLYRALALSTERQ